MSVDPIQPSGSDPVRPSGPLDATRPEPQSADNVLNSQATEARSSQTERIAASQNASREPSGTDRTDVPSHTPTAIEPVLTYHIDDQTRRVYFQIIDEVSGRVLRQVPPEEILNAERYFSELAKKQSQAATEANSKASS